MHASTHSLSERGEGDYVGVSPTCSDAKKPNAQLKNHRDTRSKKNSDCYIGSVALQEASACILCARHIWKNVTCSVLKNHGSRNKRFKITAKTCVHTHVFAHQETTRCPLQLDISAKGWRTSRRRTPLRALGCPERASAVCELFPVSFLWSVSLSVSSVHDTSDLTRTSHRSQLSEKETVRISHTDRCLVIDHTKSTHRFADVVGNHSKGN